MTNPTTIKTAALETVAYFLAKGRTAESAIAHLSRGYWCPWQVIAEVAKAHGVCFEAPKAPLRRR